MNARLRINSLSALVAISIVAVGCSGGSPSADDAPQFQSPQGRTLAPVPSTQTPVTGNDTTDQDLLDAINESTAAANAAKDAADAAAAAATGASEAANGAKTSADAALNAAKGAENQAEKAKNRATLSAWIAGIGAAALGVGMIASYQKEKKRDRKDQEALLADAEKKHQENLGAHGGTQLLELSNSAKLDAMGAVIADGRDDQIEEYNQNGRFRSEARAYQKRSAEEDQKFRASVQTSLSEMKARADALDAKIATLTNNSAATQQALVEIKSDLARFEEALNKGVTLEQAEAMRDALGAKITSLDSQVQTLVAQGQQTVAPEVPTVEEPSVETPEGVSEEFRPAANG